VLPRRLFYAPPAKMAIQQEIIRSMRLFFLPGVGQRRFTKDHYLRRFI
jgi:hypothetical protein